MDGFTYLLSGGNLEAAQSVWTSTMYGTYVLTPEHLKWQEVGSLDPERPLADLWAMRGRHTSATALETTDGGSASSQASLTSQPRDPASRADANPSA